MCARDRIKGINLPEYKAVYSDMYSHALYCAVWHLLYVYARQTRDMWSVQCAVVALLQAWAVLTTALP